MTAVSPARVPVAPDLKPASVVAAPVRSMPESVEELFTSFDGTELFYRVWWPGGTLARLAEKPKEALLLFHRGHEHSGRFEELVAEMGVLERGIPVFAPDLRGHGKNPGERGYAPDFQTFVRDVECFVRHINSAYSIPTSDMSILAHSVGSVIIATWVHDYAPPIRKMVLVAPAFRVKLYVPLARPGLRVLRKLRRRSFVKSYVTGKLLTHDAAQAAAYDADPLISRQIAVNILLDMHDTAERIVEDAGAIGVPTFILTAENDWVVENTATENFFAGLSSSVKVLKQQPGFFHAILSEQDRATPIAEIREFLEQDFPAHLDTTAEEAYTRREYDRITSPHVGGPRAIGFALQRSFMKSIGKLSEGIRIGLKTGFDSGESLDHVYRNAARGVSIIGKIIDREYLDNLGWRGVRARRVNLEYLLEQAIVRVRREGKPVRIMDVAAGPGRYLIETLRRLPNADIVALLRDWSESAIEEGRHLAEALGVKNVRFERGDAFKEAELAEARVAGCKPNIVVISGLYELFPDNKQVGTSLRGIARGMDHSAYLVYTNQPWHPQLEIIARVLGNREGRSWIMRRRTQAEMDQLVESVGLQKTGNGEDAEA